MKRNPKHEAPIARLKAVAEQSKADVNAATRRLVRAAEDYSRERGEAYAQEMRTRGGAE